jgi:hypothetical protein
LRSRGSISTSRRRSSGTRRSKRAWRTSHRRGRSSPALQRTAGSGGLISYGANLNEIWRRPAIFAGKILKGAKPADLPVEQPTKFELVVNMRASKALGLTIPPSILLRADQIIE